ncbi:MAG: DUF4124 domain-containing protein [Methylococcaceae bacterium]
MKLIRCFIVLNFITFPAIAEVYKCTNAAGNTVYSASTCPVGYSNIEINLSTGSHIDLDAQKNKPDLEQERQLIELKKQAQQQQQAEKLQAQWKQHALDESAKNQFLVKNNPQQFSAFAIPPYSPDNLPDLVKDYSDRLPDIERLRRLAANKALESKQCDRVENDELDGRSHKDVLMFTVNCSSGKTFHFSEQELGN